MTNKIKFIARISELVSGGPNEDTGYFKRNATEITLRAGMKREIEDAIRSMMVSGKKVEIILRQIDE